MSQVYYHFCQNNKKTRYTYEPIRVGETLYYKGQLKVCFSGLHACKSIVEALLYAPGTVLTIVELNEFQLVTNADKVSSSSRKVLFMRNIHRELVSFAQWCLSRAECLKDNVTSPPAFTQFMRAIGSAGSAGKTVLHASTYDDAAMAIQKVINASLDLEREAVKRVEESTSKPLWATFYNKAWEQADEDELVIHEAWLQNAIKGMRE